MPEVEIRPAVAEDIPMLVAIDHNYSSDYVWQMEVNRDNSLVGISFREVRLPRSVRVEYPRDYQQLEQGWESRDGLLVATMSGEIAGYISLALAVAPLTAWVQDLAVVRRQRRKGIGSLLVLSGQEWALVHDARRMVLEMQTKNYPAIHLAEKLGFDLCGYNDRYYANHDIGLFFGKSVR